MYFEDLGLLFGTSELEMVHLKKKLNWIVYAWLHTFPSLTLGCFPLVQLQFPPVKVDLDVIIPGKNNITHDALLMRSSSGNHFLLFYSHSWTPGHICFHQERIDLARVDCNLFICVLLCVFSQQRKSF